MEFSYFDVIISVIVLFLGLKGIINGFFKELFGLLGIVGGIFIASRMGDEVGTLISDTVFKFENNAAIEFTGFLVTLGLFWILMIALGAVFKKLSSLSGLGVFDKVLGFIFSASKFFLIAAVISYAAYNIKAMRSNLDSVMQKSLIFPVLVDIGGFIMKLDPVEVSSGINETIEKSKETLAKDISDSVKESSQQVLQKGKEAVEAIEKGMEQNASKKEGL